MQQTTENVCSTLRHAVEQHDLNALLNLYANNAELRVIDRNHPPSRPRVLHGTKEIGGYLRDIFSRDMSHHIEDEIVGDNSFAFTEECEYPDGNRVFMSATCQIKNGKIVRETDVQEWDG